MGYEPRPSAGLTSYTGSFTRSNIGVAAGDIITISVPCTGCAAGMTVAWSTSANFQDNVFALSYVVASNNVVDFAFLNTDLVSERETGIVTFYVRVFA